MIWRDRFHDIANDTIDNIIWYEVYWKIGWYHRKLYDIIYDIEYDIDFSYHMIFINLEHLETPESLDMVYTWYILGIYF
jgi:hypothetical protein